MIPSEVIDQTTNTLVGTVPADNGNVASGQQGYLASLIATAPASLIQEGVGEGLYFAPDGVGAAYRPAEPSNSTAGLDYQATPYLVDGADGHGDQHHLRQYGNPATREHGGAPTTGAVPTVFNGDFSAGLSQSMSTLFDGSSNNPVLDQGRFPVSYQLPGWSFQGGGGYFDTITNGLLLSLGVSQVDITGLFALPTNNIPQLFTSVLAGTTSTAGPLTQWTNELLTAFGGQSRTINTTSNRTRPIRRWTRCMRLRTRLSRRSMQASGRLKRRVRRMSIYGRLTNCRAFSILVPAPPIRSPRR